MAKNLLWVWYFRKWHNVWNFLDETNNDYTNVAHISDTGQSFVGNLPDTAKKALEEKATEIRSEIETQMKCPIQM